MRDIARLLASRARPSVRLGLLVAGLWVGPGPAAVAQNTLDVHVVHVYLVGINAVIGRGYRVGVDTVRGLITRQPDGTWKGIATGIVNFTQAIRALGIAVCPQFDYHGTQRLQLTATPARRFNPRSQTILPDTGTPNGGFLALTLTPLDSAQMNSTECLDLHQAGPMAKPMLPLNDSRWDDPVAPYVIGIPRSGVLSYVDLAADTSPDSTWKQYLKEPVMVRAGFYIRVRRR